MTATARYLMMVVALLLLTAGCDSLSGPETGGDLGSTELHGVEEEDPGGGATDPRVFSIEIVLVDDALQFKAYGVLSDEGAVLVKKRDQSNNGAWSELRELYGANGTLTLELEAADSPDGPSHVTGTFIVESGTGDYEGFQARGTFTGKFDGAKIVWEGFQGQTGS
ncbi:MAG: hypothetical protein ACE5G0_14765 [Rhodothermales bacterium]